MTFGRLGVLGSLGNLGGGAGRAGFFPGAVTDLRFDKQLYLANNRRYAAFTDIPGESSSGGANGTVSDNGVITSASAPRIGRGTGLLVEGAATNLLTYSEDFTNAAWSKLAGGTGFAPVVTANAGLAPDGTMTADQIAFDAGSGTSNSSISIIRATATVSAVDYTGSIWLRTSAGSAQIVIRHVASAAYDLLTVTEEWQRFSTVEFGAVGTGEKFSFGVRQGVQGTINAQATVLAWGAQLETGSTASTYIPTAGSSVTRTADSVTLATADLGWASDQTVNLVYDDGTTTTIAAVAGTFTFPASAKKYARAYA